MSVGAPEPTLVRQHQQLTGHAEPSVVQPSAKREWPKTTMNHQYRYPYRVSDLAVDLRGSLVQNPGSPLKPLWRNAWFTHEPKSLVHPKITPTLTCVGSLVHLNPLRGSEPEPLPQGVGVPRRRHGGDGVP